MAVYKVPQDVEAEDKLLGPFSFRQFIYLIIVVVAGGIAWILAQISIVLIIIPIPVMIAFGALALPLKKDQPMETYLAAVVQFFLKPKRRLWDPDGTLSLVQITAPRIHEVSRVKDISENEAVDRLSYLAQLIDTRGWASRGVGGPGAGSSLIDDIAMEAEQVEDIMDESRGVAQSFSTLIEQRDAARKEEVRSRMQRASAQAQPELPEIIGNPYDQFTDRANTVEPQREVPAPAEATSSEPAPAIARPAAQEETEEPIETPHFNPYPTIHQRVIAPLDETPTKRPVSQAPAQDATPQPPKSSEERVSPDIINLATNPSLSISTIAHEAHRLQEKQNGEEVVISLR